jgi:hypothetical protein
MEKFLFKRKISFQNRRKIKMKKASMLILVLSLMFVGYGIAEASIDGTYNLTTDDAYEFYISQDDSLLGTLINSSSTWPTVESGVFGLIPGTNYLHIVGHDTRSVVSGVLGDFSLTGLYRFQNGQQYLTTNLTDWTVRLTDNTGFGWPDLTPSNYGTIISEGTNGSSPWGFRTGIGSTANWMWTNADGQKDLLQTRYFSTKISVTPEPASMLLFGLGGGVLAFFKRKRS